MSNARLKGHISLRVDLFSQVDEFIKRVIVRRTTERSDGKSTQHMHRIFATLSNVGWWFIAIKEAIVARRMLPLRFFRRTFDDHRIHVNFGIRIRSHFRFSGQIDRL